jgi:Tol biopolymer transport system component
MIYFRRRFRVLAVLIAIMLSMAIEAPLQTAKAQTAKGRARIAFVTIDYRSRTQTLSLIDPANGSITTLVKDGYFFFPTFSPDGKHIAFMAEHPKEGRRNIYVMNTDGSNLRTLLAGRPKLKPTGRVAWSPDSAQIIYGANGWDGRSAGIFRVNLDGADPQQIVIEGMKLFDYDNQWVVSSPDGKHIAFRGTADKYPNIQLYIADADGKNPHPIAPKTIKGMPFDEIVWSPDSQKTLLSVGLSYPNEALSPLMVGDADGANVQTLIKPPQRRYFIFNSVVWSPTGDQVAFLAPEKDDSKPNTEIWVANTNGSGLHALNVASDVSYVGLSWTNIPDDVTLPKEPISFTEAVK